MELLFKSTKQTQLFAKLLGAQLRGGEVFELVGDVGTGKTTFVKGLASGLGVADDVQSPSFTISRLYDARDGLKLSHYDFYRLPDAGIMSYEIAEMVADKAVVTVVEWAESVASVLPDDRIQIEFFYGANEDDRRVLLPTGVTCLEEAYATWSKN